MPRNAITHIQKIAPAPPMPSAIATPTRLPVPMREARLVANASSGEMPALSSCPLAKITRHISLDRWRKNAAGKRGGGETAVALEELEECISGGSDPEAQLRAKELRGALNRFLDGLPQRERVLFVSRYWYLRSVKQMAEETGLSESSVKTQLFRTREKLRRFLDKEGLL